MSKPTSPVVRADARFSGLPEWLIVGVWFHDKSEIDALIAALAELRDTTGDDFDHVHLQHHDLSPGCMPGLAEITFFRPGAVRTDIDDDLVTEAADFLRDASSHGTD
jgi:hypothetical protein